MHIYGQIHTRVFTSPLTTKHFLSKGWAIYFMFVNIYTHDRTQKSSNWLSVGIIQNKSFHKWMFIVWSYVIFGTMTRSQAFINQLVHALYTHSIIDLCSMMGVLALPYAI